MDHLDKEVIESLSEPAKRVFESLDYRSKQRMLKKAREMAKTEKMKRRKKSRFKKKGFFVILRYDGSIKIWVITIP